LNRLWEVDFVRGLAVLMMLVSNFVFDFTIFSDFRLESSLFWPWFARATAGLFLLVVGVSLHLSLGQLAARKAGLVKVLKRGGKTFGLGLLVTIATWYAVGDELVVFGILHLIGVGVILAYPFLGHKYLSLLAGLFFVAGGILLEKIQISSHLFIWLGLRYRGFSSVDYTPMLPWFGFILLGIFIGASLFPGGERRLQPFPLADLPPIKVIRWLGGHSLKIYFIHQPIFWAGFWLLMVS